MLSKQDRAMRAAYQYWAGYYRRCRTTTPRPALEESHREALLKARQCGAGMFR